MDSEQLDPPAAANAISITKPIFAVIEENFIQVRKRGLMLSEQLSPAADNFHISGTATLLPFIASMQGRFHGKSTNRGD
jgi:hypothetical protein